jgi:hypothetical protein
MQELPRLTLGASKIAYFAGDDSPARWERARGGVICSGFQLIDVPAGEACKIGAKLIGGLGFYGGFF